MKRYSKEQRATIFVVIITAFVTTFTGSALNLSVPTMGKEFHVSASLIGWVVTGYMLTVAALSVPFGKIADITQRKKILVLGILVFSLSSLASAFAWSFWVMILLRVAQGIGGAMIFSTNTAVLISSFPGNERGKLLGFSVASTYIGLSLGPVAGGLLNHYFGWRSIFIITFVVSGIVFYTAWKRLPSGDKIQDRGKFDLLGSILYICAIVSIMYGFSSLSDSGYYAAVTIGIGLALGVWFVRHEIKTEKPIIEVRLFTGNIAYTFSNLAALLNYGATFAIGYLLSIYLQTVMEFSSQAAGLILISQPVVMAALSPFAGKLSDKISPYILASFGMGLCAAGVLFFVFISESYPLWLIILALVVTGVGFAFFSSPNTNAVMACVEAKDYGVASSILATMRSTGHTLSMAIVTLIVGIYMGDATLSEAEPKVLIQTMHTAFIVFAAICIVGIFISAKRKSKKDKQNTNEQTGGKKPNEKTD